MMKHKFIILGSVIAVVIGAALFYFFRNDLLIPKENVNQGNVNLVPLPQDHLMTDEERLEFGYPEGVVYNITYSYDDEGNVFPTVSVVSDNRDPDDDGDGLPNNQEEQYGTDPKSPDTDGDGWRDGDEVKFGSNPLKGDTDEDGLNDLEEFSLYKTNFLVADSDDDGFTDGQEVNQGYNPLGEGKLFDDNQNISDLPINAGDVKKYSAPVNTNIELILPPD